MHKTRLIKLTKGQNAVVDADDYEDLSEYKWQATYCKAIDGYYATRNTPMENGKGTSVQMHRQILRTADGFETDHINHDTLDNRKDNLRSCTHAENKWNAGLRNTNKTGFKGVSWNSRQNQYQAKITANYKQHHLGYFDIAINAARAYDKAAVRLHGKFAHTNAAIEKLIERES